MGAIKLPAEKINHNYVRLLEAMEFTPDQWEVVGIRETNTAKHCSCGHDIVYNYPLRHKVTGRIIPIGSVCIEHAPFIPIELASQYKSIVQRLKAERRALELARQAAIKGQLADRFAANLKAFLAIYKERGNIGGKMFGNWWSDWELNKRNDKRYDFNKDCTILAESIKKLQKKKLKTSKGWIKVYTKVINDMHEFNAKYKLAMILYSSNVEVYDT